MKTLTTLLVAFSISFGVFSQTCFENCWDNFDKSTIPWPEKNNKILADLVGCKAPDFSVKSIAGKTFDLKKLQGKIVVINFWFTTCSPCVAEMPALNKLMEDYKDKDVVFIAFGRDDVLSIMKFLNTKKFDFNIVSSDYDVSKQYCMLGGWPTNIVLDKEGVVRQIFSGGRTDEKALTETYDKIKPTIEKYLN